MKKSWFKELGLIYYPISWQGFILTIFALAFCIQVFFAIDRNSHSASNTLYGVFPFVVPTILVLGWIASKTSTPRQ